MKQNGFYPATRYAAPPLIDLSDRTVREELGPAAIRAFFNIMDRWGLRSRDARRLLGGMSESAYFNLKKGAGGIPGQDRLCRISCLIGIFEALNVLYDEELADRWMQLPNQNRIFNGMMPLDYLISGGIPAFATVRNLLDARQIGH